jgi:hypothetical protein
MGQRQSHTIHPGELLGMADLRDGDGYWLSTVRHAHRASTDFLDDGIREEWEKAFYRFRNQHPPGSKYRTAAYKHRSKTFRPKTRSLSRRAEAKAAAALFSNTDLIDVRGQNRGSAEQAAAAAFNKAIMQYRLEHSIPWFLTCMGARQDTFNNGVCISLSTWEYEVRKTKTITPRFMEDGRPELDEDGDEVGDEVEVEEVIVDKPVLDLLPPENVRFDPNADWRNPFEDSPVINIMLPMYARDVMLRAKKPNPVTGEPEWREHQLGAILAAAQDKNINEIVRQARVGDNRHDPIDISASNEDTLVWVWLNIVRDEDGEDMAFYSLGGQLMLSQKPVPVRELLPLGRDSLTFGFSILESHRPYPTSANELSASMQSEVNDIANQRMDNVKLALNRRYFVRRGSQTDLAALSRSVPGGGVMTGDPENDIRVLDFPDVTGSSYQEQDRLTQELDELTGNFSSSSVQANRSLNETVGGMNMLQGDATEVSEYELRTFVETWVEPVLRKLQKLCAMFETDETILTVAGENAELQKYGVSPEIDRMLDEEMIVSVNVGMGNTNPAQRLQRFQMIIAAAANIPEIAQRMNPEEIGKEIFSLGGFNDTTRFMMSEEEFAQKMQQMQEQMAAQQPQDTSLQVAQLRAEVDRYKADKDFQIKLMTLLEEQDAKLTELTARMETERMKDRTQRDSLAVKEGTRLEEMEVRRDTGAGI